MVKRGSSPPKEDGKYVPGVNYVIRSDGRRMKVTDRNAESIAEGLETGYVVERHLMDKDVVLFNRQPSLHRMSMMAHTVRVMPWKTFRFNLCVCPPYNADFDGDEMNLHVLQSDEARAEAMILMRVQEHILSPRFGGPVIGAIHDHITGTFLLTHLDPRYDKQETMSILEKVNNEDLPTPMVDEDGKEYWTGHQLFSIVLPEDFHITFKASICRNCAVCKKEDCDLDAYVKIRKGKLITGTIDEKAIGSFKGKILDKVTRDYGADVSREFLDNVTKLAIGAIMVRGFTTGIDDEDIPEEATRQINEVLSDAVRKVSEFVQAYREGILEQLPGRSLDETLEVEVMT